MNFRLQIELCAFPLVFVFLLKKRQEGILSTNLIIKTDNKKTKVQAVVVDMQNISSVGAFYAGIEPFYSKHRSLVPMSKIIKIRKI